MVAANDKSVLYGSGVLKKEGMQAIHLRLGMCIAHVACNVSPAQMLLGAYECFWAPGS